MIKQAVHEDEIILGMLQRLQGQNKNEGMENLVKAADYLQAAAEIFDEYGLMKQSDQVMRVLLKIAHEHKTHKPGDIIEFKSMRHHPDKPGDVIEMKSLEPGKNKPDVGSYEIEMESLLSDDQDARKKKAPKDRHIPKSPEQMAENYKQFGWAFNMSDDGKADDMLNLDIKEEDPLEVVEGPEEKDFEEED
jgi:hypothetical protein